VKFNRPIAAVLPKLGKGRLLLSPNCNLSVHEEFSVLTQVVVLD
jgi:hypothetical protein